MQAHTHTHTPFLEVPSDIHGTYRTIFPLSVSSYLSHKKSRHSTQPVNSIDLQNQNSSSMATAKFTTDIGTSVQQLQAMQPGMGGGSTGAYQVPAKQLPANSGRTPQEDRSRQLVPMDSAPIPAHKSLPTNNAFNIKSLLAVGEILLISCDYKSLQLPSDFWATSDFPPVVLKQIEADFDW